MDARPRYFQTPQGNKLWLVTLLSIMLPTTVCRRKTFYPLLEKLLKQIVDVGAQEKVEILIDEDGKEKSIGRKRQDLLERATGDFVVAIDSDDDISTDYMAYIWNALTKHGDAIDHVGFLERCNINGELTVSIFSHRHQKWDENKDGFDHIRCANPKSVIRRTKALEVGYPDLRYGEDRVFSEAVTPLLTIECFINKELYYYNHTSTEHNERYGITEC